MIHWPSLVLSVDFLTIAHEHQNRRVIVQVCNPLMATVQEIVEALELYNVLLSLYIW